MPPPPSTPLCSLFVSSVEGRVVARFGTATPNQGNEPIGARKIAGGGYVWDTEAVIAISAPEEARFLREYRGAIAEGSLKKRTAEEYQAWVEKQSAAAPSAPAETSAEPAPAETTSAPTTRKK